MKIVIADDSRVMRNIIERIVSPLGHETLHAGNGQEALDLLEAHGETIGLMLLDWNMPVMNGLEVLKTMRDNGVHQNTPVLMVSTESEGEKTMQALKAGAQGYLPKPFTAEDLTSMIRKTLKGVI